MKKFFAFLKTRIFLINLGLAILTAILIVVGLNIFLSSYTHHNDEDIEVPDLVGVKIEQVNTYLEPKGLKYEITDSVFSEKGAAGTVIVQYPRPSKITNEKVKVGRTIYLSVVSKSKKMIAMPKLKDKSRRHAEGVLKIIGLKSKPKYQPYNDCNDCVIEQLYKGKPIKPGQLIPKGETITLVLGQKSSEQMDVPNLMGLTIDDANSRLSNSSLVLYVAGCEGCGTRQDSLKAVINKQMPIEGATVNAGSEINVWLTTTPEQ